MPKIVGRREIVKGKLVTLEVVATEYEAGSTAEREVVRHQPVVAVVALQEQTDVVAQGHQVVMVRQFRPAVGEQVLELVAGLVDEGEEPLASAKRELQEEVGLVAAEWVELGSLLSSPGFTDERVTLFLARGVRQVGANLGEHEHLSVSVRPLTLALADIQRGEIRDAKTVAGLLWASYYLEQEREGR